MMPKLVPKTFGPSQPPKLLSCLGGSEFILTYLHVRTYLVYFYLTEAT